MSDSHQGGGKPPTPLSHTITSLFKTPGIDNVGARATQRVSVRMRLRDHWGGRAKGRRNTEPGIGTRQTVHLAKVYNLHHPPLETARHVAIFPEGTRATQDTLCP